MVPDHRRPCDSKESYETFFSPKLSAGGFLRPYTSGAVSSVKIFGNIGKGIKSPTFTERFGGSFADPSPGLKAERARTADLGVEATFANQRVRGSAAYFDNQFRDQIEFFKPIRASVPMAFRTTRISPARKRGGWSSKAHCCVAWAA